MLCVLANNFDWALWNGPPHPQAFAEKTPFRGGISESETTCSSSARSNVDDSTSDSEGDDKHTSSQHTDTHVSTPELISDSVDRESEEEEEAENEDDDGGGAQFNGLEV